MSAPVLNAPQFQAPGQPVGAGQGVGAKAPAGGVLAGFEAMLAALLHQAAGAEAGAGLGQAVAGPLAAGQPVDPKAARAKTGKDGKALTEVKDGKDGKGGAETKADDAAKAAAASDTTQTLAAGTVVQPAVTPQPPVTPAAASAPSEATGDGRAKTAGPQVAMTFEPALPGAPGAAKAALLQVAGPSGAKAKGATPAVDPAAGAPPAEAATPKPASFTAPAPAPDAQAAAAPIPTPSPAKPTVQAAAETRLKTAPGDAPTTARVTTTQAATEQPTAKAEPVGRGTPAPAPDAATQAQAADAATPALSQASPPAPPRRADNAPRSSGRERTGGKIQTAAAAAAPSLHAAAPVSRTEGAKTEALADPIAAATSGGDEAAPQEAPKDSSGPAFAQTDPNNQAPTVATPAAMHAAAVAVRGAPQTVANLAAQIVKKLESKTTRFDVQLDPAGLGKVDVRVEIGAQGRITAALACHTAQGAEALRARSGELQQALEQAGFDVSGGLSFEMAGGQGGQTGAGQGQNDRNDFGQAFRGRAFQSGLDVAGDAAQAAADVAARLNRSRSAGVDIRI